MGKCNSKQEEGSCGDPESKCNPKPTDRDDYQMWTDCYKAECVRHYKSAGGGEKQREQAMKMDCEARNLEFVREFNHCGDGHWQGKCTRPSGGTASGGASGGGASGGGASGGGTSSGGGSGGGSASGGGSGGGSASGGASGGGGTEDPFPFVPPDALAEQESDNTMMLVIGGGVAMVMVMMMMSSSGEAKKDDEY